MVEKGADVNAQGGNYGTAPQAASTDTIKSFLWIAVEQNARKLGSILAYKHMMNMSCEFHNNVHLCDLYKAIDGVCVPLRCAIRAARPVTRELYRLSVNIGKERDLSS